MAEECNKVAHCTAIWPAQITFLPFAVVIASALHVSQRMPCAAALSVLLLALLAPRMRATHTVVGHETPQTAPACPAQHTCVRVESMTGGPRWLALQPTAFGATAKHTGHSWWQGTVLGGNGTHARLRRDERTSCFVQGLLHTAGAAVPEELTGPKRASGTECVLWTVPSGGSDTGDSCGGAVAGSLAAVAKETAVRWRRGAPASSEHVECGVYLDADASFFAAWGGSEGSMEARMARAIVRMVDVIFQVDGVLQFDGNLRGEIQLRVVGAQVHPGLQLDTKGGGGVGLLRAYQRWLGKGIPARGVDRPTSSGVCLNHLFTHTGLAGVLGVAIQASPQTDVIGGLCETRVVGGAALNVGLTSTLSSRNGDVPLWQTVLSATHEVRPMAGGMEEMKVHGATWGRRE